MSFPPFSFPPFHSPKTQRGAKPTTKFAIEHSDTPLVLYEHTQMTQANRHTVNDNTSSTPNLPTNIVDFRGFESNIIFMLRGGIPRPTGDFLEIVSQAMLVGIMKVGRLGVTLVLNGHTHKTQAYDNMMMMMTINASSTQQQQQPQQQHYYYYYYYYY